MSLTFRQLLDDKCEKIDYRRAASLLDSRKQATQRAAELFRDFDQSQVPPEEEQAHKAQLATNIRNLAPQIDTTIWIDWNWEPRSQASISQIESDKKQAFGLAPPPPSVAESPLSRGRSDHQVFFLGGRHERVCFFAHALTRIPQFTSLRNSNTADFEHSVFSDLPILSLYVTDGCVVTIHCSVLNTSEIERDYALRKWRRPARRRAAIVLLSAKYIVDAMFVAREFDAALHELYSLDTLKKTRDTTPILRSLNNLLLVKNVIDDSLAAHENLSLHYIRATHESRFVKRLAEDHLALTKKWRDTFDRLEQKLQRATEMAIASVNDERNARDRRWQRHIKRLELWVLPLLLAGSFWGMNFQFFETTATPSETAKRFVGLSPIEWVCFVTSLLIGVAGVRWAGALADREGDS